MTAGTSPDNPKFLVVKATIGAGLGDRIRALLSAILYTKLSGRYLVVAWDDGLYGEDGRNIFPELFELVDMPVYPFDTTADWTVYPPVWQGHLHQPMKFLYRRFGPKVWDRKKTMELFSFDQSRLDYPEDVLVMWEFDQFGKIWNIWRTHPALASFRSSDSLMRELARCHIRPADKVKSLIDNYKRGRWQETMIGVHIRKTHESGGIVKNIPEERYHRVIRRIQRKYPNVGLFLATDNIDVEQRFKQCYSDVLTTEKWFAPPGQPLHVDSGRAERFDTAIEALVDMFLLASCHYLIYPQWSSFSMISALFSQTEQRCIVPLNKLSGVRSYILFIKKLWQL